MIGLQLANLMIASESAGSLPDGLVALVLLGLFSLGVGLWIRKFLVRCLCALPEEHWHVQPWTSWFLLLPPLNLIWNFHFLLGLSQAYTNAFEDLGRALPARESGRVEAALFSVTLCVGWYPMAQSLLAVLWMAGLVSLTIYLFKIHSLSERFARIRVDS